MSQTMPYRVGRWLPRDQEVLDTWLENLVRSVKEPDETNFDDELDACDQARVIPGLHPSVRELKDLIENDSEISKYFHQMFAQVPVKPPYSKDQAMGHNYRVMLLCINKILTTAPEYSSKDLVGFPINAILNWPMATVGGHAAFPNDKVNNQLKKVLDAWGKFLESPESCYVLSNDPRTGWFGEDAMKEMKEFVMDFVCNPSKKHYGFNSWDDFFTRQFRPGRRPIASPHDKKIIVNACESATFNIQFNVSRGSQFWIKSQPYSVQFLLANDALSEQFIGGTVYQAYLSALSYHRWHSPVDGVIRKAYIVEGSSDPVAPKRYLTEVAARAVIFIEADNRYIGLMAFVAIGMAEVFSNEITVFEGQRVRKGQELGMFHFGGSTHSLLFRRGVDVQFVVEQKEIGEYPEENIPVNAEIARVPFEKL